MKITQVKLGRISTPLRVPFKTALRTVRSVEDVIVELHTDTGAVGYGEAPPTGVITGDTTGAIIGAIRDHIAPAILGRDLDEFEDLTAAVQKALDASYERHRRKHIHKLLSTLTAREMQIFRMVCQGRKNSDIAEELFVSKRTVEVHRMHISRKLGYAAPIRFLWELAELEEVTPMGKAAGKIDAADAAETDDASEEDDEE